LRKTAETEISDLTFWLRFGSVRVFINRNRTEIRFPHIPNFNMYCIVTVVRFVIILIKFYVCMYLLSSRMFLVLYVTMSRILPNYGYMFYVFLFSAHVNDRMILCIP